MSYICCHCNFDTDDHWYEVNKKTNTIRTLCPRPVQYFLETDPPVVEESWTEEDEMLFNTFSEYMND